ncbi:MAG TPA: hypothetical protein P5089_03935 [Candidatus Portnoybacteria bacterium]|nr:hypothetical protein [Candidatus Portnoybacteria bacterium]
MPTLTKNKKIAIGFISVFLVLGSIFVFNVSNAQAGFLDAITKPGDFVMEVLAWGAYGILWLFSKLIAIAAFLLETSFKIEDIGFTKASIVTNGWEVTRGLCNMIFALLLLLMAFDTILQTDKFPVKSILPKLIIVALTINFSLMLLGIIIDFSQILTRYFIDAAGGSSGSISEQLANSLNIAKVFQVNTNLNDTANIQKSLGGGSASLLQIFGTLVFGIVIILIATFSLAAGAIFMLLRLVSLWVLLIFAPIAWMGMIAPLPGLKGFIDDWWNKFFKWTFFAPIYAFFIYLAVSVASVSSLFNIGSSATQKAIGNVFVSDFLSDIGKLMQYIVVIALLIMGIKTAEQVGLSGANTVVGWGKKAGSKLRSLPQKAFEATGIPGGVKERYGELKDKYLAAPLAKRQAQVATALGSSSALEKNMKTRAGEYEKNKSLPDIQSLAKRGDASAVYALANMGEIDAATYQAFSSNNKNGKIQKSVDVKVGKKRADLVAFNNAKEKAKKILKEKATDPTYAAIKAANPTWSDNDIAEQIEDDTVEQEIGKLTTEKLTDLKWSEIEKNLLSGSKDRTRMASATFKSLSSMISKPGVQADLAKRLSPTDAAAINKLVGTNIV